MGMIVKSIVTGVVLAGLAGGGVYYGLSPDGLSDLGIDRASERSDPIPAKKVTVKKTAEAGHPHTDKAKTKSKKNASDIDEPKPEKKWIDQYLDDESSDDDKKPKKTMKSTRTVTTSDTDTRDDKSDETDVASVESDTKDKDVKTVYKAARADPIIIDTGDVSDDMIAEIKGLLDALQAEDRDKVIIAKTRIRSESSDGKMVTMDSYKTLEIITEQAEKIGSDDLKDRAYLGVVNYALAHEYFGEAKAALSNIVQPELRETARSRIAVKYAQSGNPDAAFETVNDVEIEDFKDPLRIQIIETLIGQDPVMRVSE